MDSDNDIGNGNGNGDEFDDENDNDYGNGDNFENENENDNGASRTPHVPGGPPPPPPPSRHGGLSGQQRVVRVTRRMLAPITATAANAANTANRGANPSASRPTTASPPRGIHNRKGLSEKTLCNGEVGWQGKLSYGGGEIIRFGTFDNKEEGFRSYDRMLISFESNHIFIEKGYRLNYPISIYEAETDDLEHLAQDLNDENAISNRLVELDTAWRGRQ